MSQESFLRDLDARITGALADAGLADLATYTPPGELPAPIEDCHVTIDYNAEVVGDDAGAVVGTRTVARLLASEIASPARGGTLTIGDRTWRLERPLSREPGVSSLWVVTADA